MQTQKTLFVTGRFAEQSKVSRRRHLQIRRGPGGGQNFSRTHFPDRQTGRDPFNQSFHHPLDPIWGTYRVCEADLKTKNPNYSWCSAHLQNSVANEINRFLFFLIKYLDIISWDCGVVSGGRAGLRSWSFWGCELTPTTVVCRRWLWQFPGIWRCTCWRMWTLPSW